MKYFDSALNAAVDLNTCYANLLPYKFVCLFHSHALNDENDVCGQCAVFYLALLLTSIQNKSFYAAKKVAFSNKLSF
jgi:hypothetical protein